MVAPGIVHRQMIRFPVAGAVPTAVDESSISYVPATVVWRNNFLGVVADKEWDPVRATRDLAVTWSETGPMLQTGTKGVHDFIRAAEIKSAKNTTE